MITKNEFSIIDIKRYNINEISYDQRLLMKVIKSIYKWNETWNRVYESEYKIMWQLYDNKKYLEKSKEKTWIWIERKRKMISLLIKSISFILNKFLIHKNYYHLYSLMNKDIFWLFSYFINDILDILIFNLNVINYYMNQIFIKKIYISIQKFPIKK